MTCKSDDREGAKRRDAPRIGRQHTLLGPPMTITKLALIATAMVAAAIGVSACSTSTPAGQTTGGASKPASTSSSAPAGTPGADQGGSCQVNPATAPMRTAGPYEPVPEDGRISVALSGISSGIVTPGSAPTEVDVTLCNNSAVAYPKIGVVVVLEHCSCATVPSAMPKGTVERFDPATGGWTQLEHSVMGTGMDYLGTYSNVQELPKGKAVTLRYRIALDASMSEGKGGVSATAVVADSPPIQIGKADLPFKVSTGPTTPFNGPTPTPRQTVLPFAGLTYPTGASRW
jgi:hypothetical protein